MNNSTFLSLSVISGCLMLMVTFSEESFAGVPLDEGQFAIYSSSDIHLTSYSLANGEIYAGNDLTLDNFYGGQRPTQNLGDMYVGNDLTTGSMCYITGDVFANNNVSLDYWNDVSGNVTYGGTVTYDDRGDIHGQIIRQPNSVPAVPLPPATQFTAGNSDVTSSDDLHLAPGAYRHVTMGGLYDEFHLQSGNYYMESLTLEKSCYVHLDLSGGPINVFVEGDINIVWGADFFINGEPLEEDSPDALRDLACDVLFESHGNVTAGYLYDDFFGTIFAPYGDVVINQQEMSGQIIAGGRIDGEVYMDYRPSSYLASVPVPKPGDANNDGRVDGSDVTILAGNWQLGVGDGQTATWAMGDFNADGQVDGSDVTILAGNWQHGVTSATASVPEPSMIVLLLIGACSLGFGKIKGSGMLCRKA